MNAGAGLRLADRRPGRVSFGEFVGLAQAAGELVVQPRMGFGDPGRMREGLLATRTAAATTVGTLTLDSYTRTGAHDTARAALDEGRDLNGYPIVAHGPAVTRALLDGIRDADFPVQVRHGSARPQDIFTALIAAGLDATEGGPVSYCLPYSRLPIARSVENWVRCCEILAGVRDSGVEPHLETFGGCMMGQLCPPSLLVALSVLEGMFFRQHGLRSISLSYAQQTSAEQDEEAVLALRRLAWELLPAVDWHVVVYTYMGVYPRSEPGALELLKEAAQLAMRTDSARLIVKTVAEAFRIPTVAENVQALEHAAQVAAAEPRRRTPVGPGPDTAVYTEARALIEGVLDLGPDLGRSLPEAFARGRLDVPFCLHPDNAGRARSFIGDDGRLRWSETGAMPIARVAEVDRRRAMTSADLIGSLTYVERKFDIAAARRPGVPQLTR
ncbi:methylaspartate mutase [Kitasatospora sp. NPDC088346]|uniref:methylaspartate mutase n=1 Tax=Kitasatospora sp. NPDC088346 TaxID=3364073 RepID=UPI0037FC6D05